MFLDHFAFCLKCKRGCSLALNNVNGNFQSDLLRNHYNYLQFAYYKREYFNLAMINFIKLIERNIFTEIKKHKAAYFHRM